MKSLKLLFLGLSLLLSEFITAQFYVNSEIRPRVEYRDGYARLLTQDEASAFFISQRSLVGLNFKKDNIKTKFVFQDARVWGADNNFALYEAWVQYGLNKNTSLKFGRQELHYDDGRLISKRPRRQDGFFYDALVFKYAKDSLYFDAGISINNSAENVVGNNYAFAASKFKSFNYIFLKKYFNNGFTVSVTGITSGFQQPDTDTTYFKQTAGTKLSYKKDGLSASVEAYYQTGKHKDGRDVAASLLAVNAGYKFSKSTKLTVGAEIVSGHDATNTNVDYQNTLHTFDILEGARFRYWGNANLIRNVEKHTKGGGLIDYYARLGLTANKKWTTNITYHNFSLNNNVLDANANILSNGLGSEIDVISKYKINKHTTAVMGYALILPTSSFEFIQNIGTGEAKNGHYLWFMISTKLNSKFLDRNKLILLFLYYGTQAKIYRNINSRRKKFIAKRI